MIASAGMHGLLLVVLLVGSAFSSKKVEPTLQVIDLVDFKVTDGKTSGGGNPTVTQPPPPEPEPPAPQPPEPEPEPEPPKPVPQVVKQPDPPKPEPIKIPEPEVVVPKVVKPEPKPQVKLTPVKPARTEPKPVAAKPQPKPQISLRPTTRTATPTKRPTAKPDNSAKLAAAIASNRRNTSASIRSSASSSTSVEMPGPGGEAFVNYRDLVAATYDRAYDRAVRQAGEIGDRDDSVDVAIVIGNNGRIISARITRNSGNPALNKLVKGVLDSVDSVPGFPSGTRDTQRTFNITFDLKSRRLTG